MKKQAMSQTNSVEYGGQMCMHEIIITRKMICSKPGFCVHYEDGTVLAEFVEADPGWVCKCDMFGPTGKFIHIHKNVNIELAILMEIRRGQLNENKLLTILEKCNIWLYLQSNPENVGKDFFHILNHLQNEQTIKALWETAHKAIWNDKNLIKEMSLDTLGSIYNPNKTVDRCPWCDSDLDSSTSCLCGFGD